MTVDMQPIETPHLTPKDVPAWGRPLSRDEVDRLLARCKSSFNQPMTNDDHAIHTLIDLMAKSQQGVLLSAVQKNLGLHSRTGANRGNQAAKLRGKANTFAKEYLRHYVDDGNDFFWAGFSCNVHAADPLMILVWRSSKETRGRGPTGPPISPPDEIAPPPLISPHTKANDCAVVHPEKEAQPIGARLHTEDGGVIDRDLFGMLRDSQSTADDTWEDTRVPIECRWLQVLKICAGQFFPGENNQPIFIRCLSIRNWCHACATEILCALTQMGMLGRRCEVVTFEPDDPLSGTTNVDNLRSFCDRGGAPPTVIVFLIGFRRAQDSNYLLESLLRINKDVLVVVFGYVASAEAGKFVGWRMFEIAAQSAIVGKDECAAPAGLDQHFSPLTRLLRRPECRKLYMPPSGGNSESRGSDITRWRHTFASIRLFILENCRVDTDIGTLAASWAARMDDPIADPAILSLEKSSLFFYGLSDLGGRPMIRIGSLIAGAIGAYLDGVTIARTFGAAGLPQRLFDHILNEARCCRRLPVDATVSLAQLTSWMALLISIHEASDENATRIVNAVAKIDANIAFDLHAIRTLVTNRAAYGDEVIARFFQHAYTHGQGLPQQFRGVLDGNRHTINSHNVAFADSAGASDVIRRVRDLDVAATLLASCAAVDRSSLVSLWETVVPAEITHFLWALGIRLRKTAVRVLDKGPGMHIYGSARPIQISDLLPVFPGIDRCHSRGAQVALMPWLSAYLLAFGCGGSLPTDDHFRSIAEFREVRSAVSSDGVRASSMLPWSSAEWLASVTPSGHVMGSEFRGEHPSFLDRRVGKANWQQGGIRDLHIFTEFANTQLTARPDREKLAACRVFFKI